MSRAMSTSPGKSPLEAFLKQYWEDEDAGTPRELDAYLALFPGDASRIAREFLRLRGHEELPPERAPEARDERRLGHYSLVEEIGRGGQGIVYRAIDTRLGRDVALKVLRNVGLLSGDLLARFRREAAVASKLDHPNICTVYEAGTESDVPYIAMQLIDGQPLDRVISTRREGNSATLECIDLDDDTTLEDDPSEQETPNRGLDRTEIDRLVRLFEKIARALHVAHEEGVVHRDIKPGNIILRADGEPVIMDFGLAADLDSELATLTRTGDLFGTPAYMSPEQLTRGALRIDRRSDVWSLGATLYESMTFERPFGGSTRDSLYHAIRTKDPIDPRRLNPTISRDLGVIIGCALQKDRDARYQATLDLAEELRRVHEGKPILARPLSPVGRIARWGRRNRAAACVLVLLVIGTAAASFGTIAFQSLADDERLAREEVEDSRNATNEALCNSLVNLARAHLSSRERARTDDVLGSLRRAESLRREATRYCQELGRAPSGSLPSQSEIRTLAVRALSTTRLTHVREFEFDQDQHHPIVISPNGRFGAVVRRNGPREIRILDFASGSEYDATLELDAQIIALSPQGTRAAAVTEDRSLVLVNTRTGAADRNLGRTSLTKRRTRDRRSVFSRSGDRLACLEGESVRVWDLKSELSAPVSSAVTSARELLEFSTDERRISIRTPAGIALVPSDVESISRGTELPVRDTLATRLTADGRVVALIAEKDGAEESLTVRDLSNKRTVASIAQPAAATKGWALCPEVRHLAGPFNQGSTSQGMLTGDICIADLARPDSPTIIIQAHDTHARALCWSGVDSLVTLGADARIRVWRVTGQSSAFESLELRTSGTAGELIPANVLSMEANEHRLAIVAANRIVIFDAITGDTVSSIELDRQPRSARLSGETNLVVNTPPTRAVVIDLQTGRKLAEVSTAGDGPRVVGIGSSRGKLFAALETAGLLKTVRLGPGTLDVAEDDLPTPVMELPLDGYTTQISDRWVMRLSEPEEGTLEIWDLDTGEQVPHAIRVGSDFVRYVSLSLVLSGELMLGLRFGEGTVLEFSEVGGRMRPRVRGSIEAALMGMQVRVLHRRTGRLLLSKPINIVKNRFAISETLFARSATDGVSLFDLQDGAKLFEWRHPLLVSHHLSPSGGRLTTVGVDGSVTRLDLEKLREHLTPLGLGW